MNLEASSVQFYADPDSKFESYEGIPCLCAKGLHAEIARILSELSPRPKTVLDLGCGRGALSRRLHDHGFELTASDILDHFEPKDLIPFVQATAEEPAVSGTFDAILMIELLQAIESPFMVVRQYGPRVKPGGHLIISVPNVQADVNRIEYFLRHQFRYYEPQNVAQERTISPIFDWQMRRVLEDLGFTSIERKSLLPWETPKVGATWAALRLLEAYRKVASVGRDSGRISCWVAHRPK